MFRGVGSVVVFLLCLSPALAAVLPVAQEAGYHNPLYTDMISPSETGQTAITFTTNALEIGLSTATVFVDGSGALHLDSITGSAVLGSGEALGNNSIAIGQYVRSNNDNAVVLGSGTASNILESTQSNSLLVGFQNQETFFVGNGRVGVGTTSPADTLQVAGNARLTGDLLDGSGANFFSGGANATETVTGIGSDGTIQTAPINFTALGGLNCDLQFGSTTFHGVINPVNTYPNATCPSGTIQTGLKWHGDSFLDQTCDSSNCGVFCTAINLSCGGVTAPPSPSCGDGICSPPTEDASSCPADCSSPSPGPFCGDGTCDATEDASSCPADCSSPSPGPTCGDGTCDASETPSSCTADCGLSLGATCTSASECNSGYCYTDSDGDGYSVTGTSDAQGTCHLSYAASQPDCSDADSDTYPGQPAFFDSPGGNGYDYDCDGFVTKEKTGTYTECATVGPNNYYAEITSSFCNPEAVAGASGGIIATCSTAGSSASWTTESCGAIVERFGVGAVPLHTDSACNSPAEVDGYIYQSTQGCN